jgi:hypothetical protein
VARGDPYYRSHGKRFLEEFPSEGNAFDPKIEVTLGSRFVIGYTEETILIELDDRLGEVFMKAEPQTNNYHSTDSIISIYLANVTKWPAWLAHRPTNVERPSGTVLRVSRLRQLF